MAPDKHPDDLDGLDDLDRKLVADMDEVRQQYDDEPATDDAPDGEPKS
ncbi:hypothetical protein [Fimbriiglobus ruber]|uniref:Uncharacterized protein n=1 Tax=Fimbriiglobus ruber TaxID=1908690 RepID=A0A225E153_9BACT|nr:hypothetical protein [Fimbriiglobus ruber]OWK42097.1 hypothetical protein FRUB_04175 [Fimbriiglobus ruber]